MVPRLKEFDQVEERRFSEKAADHRRVVDVEGVCLGDGPVLHPAGAPVVGRPIRRKKSRFFYYSSSAFSGF